VCQCKISGVEVKLLVLSMAVLRDGGLEALNLSQNNLGDAGIEVSHGLCGGRGVRCVCNTQWLASTSIGEG
jgi:hypothetical protein